MNEAINGMIGLALIVIIGIAVLGIYQTTQFNSIKDDLNILKNNDKAFGEYILANSQTTTYLQENCKITNDTNELTTLTCIKPKVNP
jgi:hypothetical protein